GRGRRTPPPGRAARQDRPGGAAGQGQRGGVSPGTGPGLLQRWRPRRVQKKNLGSYISTQQGLIQPRIANLNKSLPAGGQVQQEQGKPISEENLNAAWQRALERYGKTPEDLDKGNLPDGLVRELRILRDIRVLN